MKPQQPLAPPPEPKPNTCPKRRPTVRWRTTMSWRAALLKIVAKQMDSFLSRNRSIMRLRRLKLLEDLLDNNSKFVNTYSVVYL